MENSRPISLEVYRRERREEAGATAPADVIRSTGGALVDFPTDRRAALCLRGYEAILFDLDDTLCDGRLESDELARSLGRFARHGGGRRSQMSMASGAWDSVSRRSVLGRETAGYRSARGKARAESDDVLTRDTVEYGGIPEMLDVLSEDFALGLIVTGERLRQEERIDALGIGHHFDVVVFSEEVCGPRVRQPCQRALMTALSALATPASAALWVADDPRADIAPARELGIATVRTRSGRYAQVLSEPGRRADWELGSAVELLNHL